MSLSFEYPSYTVSESERGLVVKIKKEPRPDGMEAETEIEYGISIQIASVGQQNEAIEGVDYIPLEQLKFFLVLVRFNLTFIQINSI